jgi:hypothetical protein
VDVSQAGGGMDGVFGFGSWVRLNSHHWQL